MAFLVWTLLAASGVYWLIQLVAKPLPTPAQALPVAERAAAQADLTRLFGLPVTAPSAAPAADARFKLLGVVAPGRRALSAEDQGVALIAVDGVARTVRVGAEVADGLRLLRLDSRSADLGREDGVASVKLQLAAPSPVATGTLAPASFSPVNLGGAAPNVAPPPPAVPQQPLQAMQPQVDSLGRPTGTTSAASSQ